MAASALAAVPAVLDRLDRFEIDTVVRATAAASTAAPLTALVAQDHRLRQTAADLEIPVVAPGARP